jgi:hypothetical protein
MKTLKLAVLSLALLLVPMLAQAQQNNLTQTSLSAAVTANATSLQVASATGITVGTNSYNTSIYIDRELLTVTAISGTTLSVLRGQGGTGAAAHSASNMVLAGRPSWFSAFDPQGTCVLANVVATPIVNYKNGNQWICSSVTLTFVPGFSNGTSIPEVVTTAVASVAGTTTPSGPLFHITGTNAITAWGIPVGCNATVRGGCSFTVIPDAAFTTTATNNIATAVTAVINLAMIWTWDASNSKFVVLQSK